MQSYPPPPATDGLTAEQAQATVNKMAADFQGDPEHPWMNRGHPQHKDFADYSRRLHTIIAEDTAAKQEAADAKYVADLEAGNLPRQQAIRAEAAEEMKALVALGFDEAEISPHVQPHDVTALRMQRLNAQNDLEHLAPLMEKELCGLHAPQDTLDAFRSYVNVPNLDPELRADIFERLISWIHKANTARYGKSKSTPAGGGAGDNPETPTPYKTYGRRIK